MASPVLARTLADHRRSLVGWSLGMVVLALITVAVWPSIRDQPDITEFIEDLPDAFLAVFGIDPDTNFLSPVGFVNSRVYAALGPLLLLMFSMGFGVRAIAGEEQQGTLELVLAHPVERGRVVIEKWAALVVMLFGIGGALWLVVWVGTLAFDIDLSFGGVLAASLAIVLLAVLFGTLALALGAATGRRALSLGVGSAVAVGTYFLWSLAPLVSWLDSLRWLSPWHYAQDGPPLADGLPFGHAAVLVGLTVVFLAVAVWGFRRRDVGV